MAATLPTVSDRMLNVMPRIYTKVPEEIRFWSKVEVTGFCWYWTGGKTRGGYGMFHAKSSKTRYVHRIAYEWLVGPIPSGLVLDHLCNTRECVNPDHVVPVTQQANMLRSNHPKHMARRTGLCKKGHRIEGDNMYEWTNKKTGYTMRRCNACRRERERVG